jgi:hypothetical protein
VDRVRQREGKVDIAREGVDIARQTDKHVGTYGVMYMSR